MKVRDIYNFLNKKFPVESAADFDNVGILIGSADCTVTAAVVALDCTPAALKLAASTGAQLIITHHPVIFEPLATLPEHSMPAMLIKSGISVISMHTNLDVSAGGVNDTLCTVLGLCNVKKVSAGDGFMLHTGIINGGMSPGAFARYAADRLHANVRYTVGGSTVNKVAVCSGSGGGYLADAVNLGADALVTGDVKHSVFIEADIKKFTLVDAGHFSTEDIIIEPLAALIRSEFPQLNINTVHYFPVNTVSVI